MDASEPLIAALTTTHHVPYVFRVDDGALPLEYVGPGFRELTGHALPADLRAAAGVWSEIIHVDDRAREAAYMARLARGEAADEVYRVVRPDGAVRWLWDRGAALADAGDGIVRVGALVGPAPDDVVAARVRRLALSTTTYTATVGADAIVAASVGGDWADTTGLDDAPSTALIALSAAVHAADVDVLRERDRLLHTGLPFDGAYRVVDRDGQTRWLSEHVAPTVRDGRAVADGTITNVTGQHALFPEVRRLDEHLRGLIETLGAHVYTIALEADGSERSEFLGPRLDVIYGATPPPATDVDALWRQSVHADDLRALDARWQRVVAGTPSTCLYRLRGLDGVERWIRDHARLRRGDDGRLRIDGIATRVAGGLAEPDDDFRSARRAARVLGELKDAVFEYERDEEGWRATFASQAMAALVGGPLPDASEVRDAVLERVHPQDRRRYDALRTSVEAGRDAQTTLRLVGLDGRTRRVLVRVRAVGSAARPRAIGTAWVLEEVTPDPSGPRLTPRQIEILALLAEGCTTDAIVERLVISQATVRNHIAAILAELGARSRLEAVAEARRRLLI